MKKFYCAMFLLTFLFTLTKAFPSCYNEKCRIPISHDQIVLSEEGVFLSFEDQLFQIAGVLEEEGNFFALPKFEAWWCNNCHYHNFYGVEYCLKCGLSRDETNS